MVSKNAKKARGSSVERTKEEITDENNDEDDDEEEEEEDDDDYYEMVKGVLFEPKTTRASRGQKP